MAAEPLISRLSLLCWAEKQEEFACGFERRAPRPDMAMAEAKISGARWVQDQDLERQKVEQASKVCPGA